jgi:hypothetical protein
VLQNTTFIVGIIHHLGFFAKATLQKADLFPSVGKRGWITGGKDWFVLRGSNEYEHTPPLPI